MAKGLALGHRSGNWNYITDYPIPSLGDPLWALWVVRELYISAIMNTTMKFRDSSIVY